MPQICNENNHIAVNRNRIYAFFPKGQFAKIYSAQRTLLFFPLYKKHYDVELPWDLSAEIKLPHLSA